MLCDRFSRLFRALQVRGIQDYALSRKFSLQFVEIVNIYIFTVDNVP